MTRSEINVGQTVKRNGIRASVRLVYQDAEYVAVIVFPQDSGWHDQTRFKDWPISEIQRSAE